MNVGGYGEGRGRDDNNDADKDFMSTSSIAYVKSATRCHPRKKITTFNFGCSRVVCLNTRQVMSNTSGMSNPFSRNDIVWVFRSFNRMTRVSCVISALVIQITRGMIWHYIIVLKPAGVVIVEMQMHGNQRDFAASMVVKIDEVHTWDRCCEG